MRRVIVSRTAWKDGEIGLARSWPRAARERLDHPVQLLRVAAEPGVPAEERAQRLAACADLLGASGERHRLVLLSLHEGGHRPEELLHERPEPLVDRAQLREPLGGALDVALRIEREALRLARHARDAVELLLERHRRGDEREGVLLRGPRHAPSLRSQPCITASSLSGSTGFVT